MSSFRNYKRYIIASKDANFFILPWACVLMKNCGVNGEFLLFKSMKEYKEQTKKLWLLLKLVFFCDHVIIKFISNFLMRIFCFRMGCILFFIVQNVYP